MDQIEIRTVLRRLWEVHTIGLKKTQWLVTELVIRDWYWVGPNIREIDWVGGWRGGGPQKVGI